MGTLKPPIRVITQIDKFISVVYGGNLIQMVASLLWHHGE
jgi:hypothetical protein